VQYYTILQERFVLMTFEVIEFTECAATNLKK
jgi:hypothetical protein